MPGAPPYSGGTGTVIDGFHVVFMIMVNLIRLHVSTSKAWKRKHLYIVSSQYLIQRLFKSKTCL